MLESSDDQSDSPWPDEVVELLRLPEVITTDEEDEDGKSLYPDDGTVTLERVVEASDGRLSFCQIVQLFREILDTVGQMHSVGFVHLQLTPEHVVVRPTEQAAGLSLEETTADAEDEQNDESGASDGNRETDQLESVETRDTSSDPSDEEMGSESTSPGAAAAEEEALAESTDPISAEAAQAAAVAEGESDPTLQDLYPLAQEVVSDLEEDSPVDTADLLPTPGADSAGWLDRLVSESDPADDNEPTELSDQTDGSVATLNQIQQAIGSLDQMDRSEWKIRLVPEKTLSKVESAPSDPATQRGFSSPEVVAGRANSGNPEAADLFSLGMLLYFLVTGQRPPTSVYSRHAPAIPSRNLRFRFPPGLEAIIKRATRPSADERFPDVEAFANAFDEAVERIRGRQQQDEPAKLIAGADRHVGIAKRRRNPVNQDRVFRAVSNDGQFGVVAVADGVSTATYGSGEIASRMFVDAAAEAWDELLPDYIMEEPSDDAEAVRQILLDANERVVDWVNERHTPFDGSPHEVMGTTALIALYRKGVVTLGSLGDSRAYLQNGPGLEQLSIDHNLWTLSILDGMEADEALSMPQGEALARCLGTFDLDDGHLKAREPDYDLMQCRVGEGDTLLLTTDGLVDFAAGTPIAAEENILATLLSEPNPELACLELILLANRGGGGDNIGLGVLRFR